MPRLMSFAKTVRAYETGLKTVTRRDGWRFLQPGDEFEGIEWNPRAGERWACRCGPASKGLDDLDLFGEECAECESAYYHRKPRRLGVSTVLAVTFDSPLSDLVPEDMLMEGVPHLTTDEFVAMYCAPGKPDPKKLVTRILFRRGWSRQSALEALEKHLGRVLVDWQFSAPAPEPPFPYAGFSVPPEYGSFVAPEQAGDGTWHWSFDNELGWLGPYDKAWNRTTS